MKLERFLTRQPDKAPPDPTGWNQCWHGYHQMDKVISDQKRKSDKKAHSRGRVPAQGLSSNEFERQIFLNTIREIQKDHIDMFELGAGRGDWCLALAGVIDHRLVPTRAKTYRCLAVEGEPAHYQWTKEHFERQGVHATAVYGAVQSYDGTCRFSTLLDPASHYGQSVRPDGNIEVPCFTVDTLMKAHGFSHVDIVHMDVQGAEMDVLTGAARAIQNQAIDYLIIGTHRRDDDLCMNRLVRDHLKDHFQVYVDIPPMTLSASTPLGETAMPVDGLMLLKRRSLVKKHYRPSLPGLSLSEAAIKERILREVPGLAEALASHPWKATVLLRDWVSNTVPRTKHELNIDLATKDPGFFKMGLAEMTARFERGDIASMCGGMAYYCMRLYRLFGFDAATFNHGISGVYTHVITLVSVPGKNGAEIYGQDALFNMHYADASSGEPLTFEQVLRRAGRDDFSSIRVVPLPITRRRYLISKEMVSLVKGKSLLNESGGILTFLDNFSLDLFREEYEEAAYLQTHYGGGSPHDWLLRLLKHYISSVGFGEPLWQEEYQRLLRTYTDMRFEHSLTRAPAGPRREGSNWTVRTARRLRSLLLRSFA